MQRETKISLPFSGHLHRFAKKDRSARLTGRGTVVGGWFFSLAFGSLPCFHCLNSPEPFGGRLIGWSQDVSSLPIFQSLQTRNLPVRDRGWLRSFSQGIL